MQSTEFHDPSYYLPFSVPTKVTIEDVCNEDLALVICCNIAHQGNLLTSLWCLVMRERKHPLCLHDMPLYIASSYLVLFYHAIIVTTSKLTFTKIIVKLLGCIPCYSSITCDTSFLQVSWTHKVPCPIFCVRAGTGWPLQQGWWLQ